jgi:hypothetical protein
MIHFILVSILISRWLSAINQNETAMILNFLTVISIVVSLIFKLISIEFVLFIFFFFIAMFVLVEKIMNLKVFHISIVWRLVLLFVVSIITGYLLTYFSNIVYFIWFEILVASSFMLGFKENFNKSQKLLEFFIQDKTESDRVNKRSKNIWILSSVIYIVITSVIYLCFV